MNDKPFDVEQFRDMSFKTEAPIIPDGLRLTGYAASMTISLSKIARQVLLKPCTNGELFLYLFRRFGYPNTGWDDDNNVAGYLLTTPMKDVYLGVYINGGDDIDLSFAVRFTPQIDYQERQEYGEPFFQYDKRAYDWLKEHYFVRIDVERQKYCYDTKQSWDVSESGEPCFDLIDPSVPVELGKDASNAQFAVMDEMHRIYSDANPDDKVTLPDYQSLHWSEIPGIAGKINIALATTMFDLERFTAVRDIYLNIFGDETVDNPDRYNPRNEDGEYDPVIEVYKYAGCTPQAVAKHLSKTSP